MQVGVVYMFVSSKTWSYGRWSRAESVEAELCGSVGRDWRQQWVGRHIRLVINEVCWRSVQFLYM